MRSGRSSYEEESSGWGGVFERVVGIVVRECGTSVGGRCCGLIADVRVAMGAVSVVAVATQTS
jgi:hypothetical protein